MFKAFLICAFKNSCMDVFPLDGFLDYKLLMGISKQILKVPKFKS